MVADIRLLVIEDSATVRAMIEQIVAQEPGCEVVGFAPDVDTARRFLLDHHPNLITLDLNMPGTGGLDFLDELAGRQHAPVVVLSSATSEHSAAAAEALARGAEACFDKSRMVAEAGRFRRLLQRALARHQRRLLQGLPSRRGAAAAT